MINHDNTWRQHGTVIRTRSVARDATWAFAALACLIALLAWGHAVDSQADKIDPAEAFYAGIAVGQAMMLDTAQDAYQQGQRAAGCANKEL